MRSAKYVTDVALRVAMANVALCKVGAKRHPQRLTMARARARLWLLTSRALHSPCSIRAKMALRAHMGFDVPNRSQSVALGWTETAVF